MSSGKIPRSNAHGQPIGWPLDTALPRPRPERTRLQGHWGFLNPLSVDHAPALFDALAEDPSGYTYLPHGPFDTLAPFATFVAKASVSEDPLFFALCTPGGTPVGHATFLRIDEAHGVIEVGFIHFSARLQRTPLATEAMYLMMAYVFDTLGYRR